MSSECQRLCQWVDGSHAGHSPEVSDEVDVGLQSPGPLPLGSGDLRLVDGWWRVWMCTVDSPSLSPSLPRSLAHTFTHSLTHSLTHALFHSPAHYLTPSQTHSLTPSLSLLTLPPSIIPLIHEWSAQSDFQELDCFVCQFSCK